MHPTDQKVRDTGDAQILDVGCGSGILGMLALKFGAGAFDGIQTWIRCAIDATHENMDANGIEAVTQYRSDDR